MIPIDICRYTLYTQDNGDGSGRKRAAMTKAMSERDDCGFPARSSAIDEREAVHKHGTASQGD